MSEEGPFHGPDEIEPTRVPLSGPNVKSTFDTPPRPDAVKAHDAAIRKHLRGRRSGQEPPAAEPPRGSGG
jgi:hypothetical protein